MTSKTAAAGHTSKHVSSTKHGKTSKHSPAKTKKTRTTGTAKAHTKATHATHAKARSSAVGDLLPVCSLEAVAQALRLGGTRVTDDDVAARWAELGELSIPDAAEAFRISVRQAVGPGAFSAENLCVPLLLGVDVPGPHAVLATSAGWWSWGELYSPWPCRVEEAWAVVL